MKDYDAILLLVLSVKEGGVVHPLFVLLFIY